VNCIAFGHHFGDEYLDWVGWQEEPAEFYWELKEGLPEFNVDGRGQPVAVDFLNQCFEYVREQLKNAKT